MPPLPPLLHNALSRVLCNDAVLNNDGAPLNHSGRLPARGGVTIGDDKAAQCRCLQSDLFGMKADCGQRHYARAAAVQDAAVVGYGNPVSTDHRMAAND